jgi:ubiquinone/menaquinone biosynthesis C-methylase UbiE
MRPRRSPKAPRTRGPQAAVQAFGTHQTRRPRKRFSYDIENNSERDQELARLKRRSALFLDTFVSDLRKAGAGEGAKILDLACGQGVRTALLAQSIPNCEVIGADSSEAMLASAREHAGVPGPKNLSFRKMRAEQLDFPDCSIDLVYARFLFQHLRDRKKVLSEIHRVLKPGGKIVIEDVDRDLAVFHPEPARWTEFIESVKTRQRLLGGDPNVGRKLATELLEQDFSTPQVELRSHISQDIEGYLNGIFKTFVELLEENEKAVAVEVERNLRHSAEGGRTFLYQTYFWVVGIRE